MKITDEDIKSFQSIFEKKYWFKIDEEEALVMWRALIQMMLVVIEKWTNNVQ